MPAGQVSAPLPEKLWESRYKLTFYLKVWKKFRYFLGSLLRRLFTNQSFFTGCSENMASLKNLNNFRVISFNFRVLKNYLEFFQASHILRNKHHNQYFQNQDFQRHLILTLLLTSAVILFSRLIDYQRRVYCPGGRKCAKNRKWVFFEKIDHGKRNTGKYKSGRNGSATGTC